MLLVACYCSALSYPWVFTAVVCADKSADNEKSADTSALEPEESALAVQ